MKNFLIISAPSGSGKTSICKKILTQDKSIEFSVSCTTRARRSKEKNGIDYIFLSQDEFIKKELLHGAQNYSPLSVVLEKGKGVYLWDVDGNKYLDMVSAYSAVSHGHSHPELVKAIKNQSEKLAITSRAFYTEPFANFLESLTNICGKMKYGRHRKN